MFELHPATRVSQPTIETYRIFRTPLVNYSQSEALSRSMASQYGSLDTTYGPIYQVFDRGLKHHKGLPVSQTSLPIAFHTDSSQKDTWPNLVGLMCIQDAFGGDTLLADASIAYGHLQRHHPWTLKILTQPFPRAIVTPGRLKTMTEIEANAFPIFSRDAKGEIELRYMRSWIEDAAQLLGRPLDELTLTALDHLDSALLRATVHQHHLRPGEMLIFNNRRFAHARHPYRDVHGKRRMLLRTWINTDQSHESLSARPVVGIAS